MHPIDDIIKIISIDPGNNLGIAIYSLKSEPLEIIDIETRTLSLDRYIDKEQAKFEILSNKLQLLHSTMNELCEKHKPHALIIESSFLNIRFPAAVTQLSQYIAVIEFTFRRFDPFISILRYPPKYIKKLFTNNGSADKDDMLKGLKEKKDLCKLMDVDLLTEHEVDATAIGYIGIEYIKKNYSILISV